MDPVPLKAHRFPRFVRLGSYWVSPSPGGVLTAHVDPWVVLVGLFVRCSTCRPYHGFSEALASGWYLTDTCLLLSAEDEKVFQLSHSSNCESMLKV